MTSSSVRRDCFPVEEEDLFATSGVLPIVTVAGLNPFFSEVKDCLFFPYLFAGKATCEVGAWEEDACEAWSIIWDS